MTDAPVAEAPADSSDDKDGDKRHYEVPTPACGRLEHEGGQVNGRGGDWKRDDNYGIDERAKHGFNGHTGPIVSITCLHGRLYRRCLRWDATFSPLPTSVPWLSA
eukprot:1521860-Pleurochrysis_carterae.AAC.5